MNSEKEFMKLTKEIFSIKDTKKRDKIVIALQNFVLAMAIEEKNKRRK